MSEENKDNKRKYLIIIIILAVLVAVLGVLQILNTSTIEDKVTQVDELKMDKLELKNDLQEMLIQYDTLTVQNDQLNAEIIAQQEQIKEMLKEIEKHKDDAYIIAKLKKEDLVYRSHKK